MSNFTIDLSKLSPMGRFLILDSICNICEKQSREIGRSLSTFNSEGDAYKDMVRWKEAFDEMRRITYEMKLKN